MNKTNAIVFSRDRPLQLDLMLSSYHKCSKDFHLLEISVVYKASNERFKKSYEVLKNEWGFVDFIEETNFKNDVINQIKGFDYVVFLTDDTIFTNKFDLDEITNLLEKHNNILGFSLRLGKNTDYCFSCNMPQDIPTMREYNKDVSIYFWPRTQFDFSYCLELSSSLYRVKDILQIIADRNFGNPNQLEDVLYSNLWQFVCFKYRMACYNISAAFANPLNQTTRTNKTNRTGNDNRYSPEKLLELYEKGARIRADKFYGLVTKSAHQLMELF
jgi:hypothetical protein